MKRKINIIPIAVLVLFSILALPYFIQNITWLLSKESIFYLFQNRWDLVIPSILVFSIFVLFLLIPRKKGMWKSSTSIYVAFIIILFTEMFGFPLTLYFLSSFVNIPTIYATPAIAFSFDLFGVRYSLLLTSLIAGFVSVIGIIFIILGWKGIFRSKNKLVTKGIFKYVRHPQYFGIMLIASIWLFAWPTLLTFVMLPILLFSYYRLAKK